jgi:chemotaxis methyl-accepting protein methylase
MYIRSINSYYQQDKLSFKSTFESAKKDKILINSLYSKFFRDDTNWSELINYIITNYSKGANVFCYACSDGSEPYTIALSLIQKLGIDRSKKFFPIIAKDIDKNRIKKNQEGIIGLTDKDILNIVELLRNTGMKFEDIFQKMIYLKPEITIGDDKHVSFIYQYKVKDMLKGLIKFDHGDIIEDTKRKFPNNSLIFFRNVWPFLTPQKTNELINNFDMNLSRNTSIIIGGFDKDYSNAAEHLLQRTFLAMDENKPVIQSGIKFNCDFPSNINYKHNGTLLPSIFVKKQSNISQQGSTNFIV